MHSPVIRGITITVRHFCRCRCTSALTAILVTLIMADMAAFEIMVARVRFTVRCVGGIQKMPKHISKVYRSLTYRTNRRSSVLLALSLSLRITTRGIRLRTSSLPTKTTHFAGQILILIVVRSAIHFVIIFLNRSPHCLRVL